MRETQRNSASINRRDLLVGGAGIAAGIAASPLMGSVNALAQNPATAEAFWVATFNLRGDHYNLPEKVRRERKFAINSIAGQQRDLRLILERDVALAGLQEVRGDWSPAEVFSPEGWHVIEYPGIARPNVTMFRLDTFELVGQNFFDTGTPKRQGKRRYPRHTTIVQTHIRHRVTGAEIMHFNTQLPKDIARGGEPAYTDDSPVRKGEDRNWRMGVAWNQIWMIYREARAASRRVGANGQPLEVIVTGDFNINYANDRKVRYHRFPWTVLERRGRNFDALRSVYSLAPRGRPIGPPTDKSSKNAYIDSIYFWKRRTSAQVRLSTHTTFPPRKDQISTDHRAVLALFSVHQPL